jgi:nicotinate-nucleotide pyrophosphorylase (carboxylating)
MKSKYTYKIIKNALEEDVGLGDITSQLTIPKNLRVKAKLISKESGVIAGILVARNVFRALDKKAKFKPLVKDGSLVKQSKILARIQGNAQKILMAERTALNLLAHLSGIATLTKNFVDKVKPYRVKILDTRKTNPDLRYLEKYAVRCGGGYNHRMGLWDMILIKDNHIQIQRDKLKDKSIEKIVNGVKAKNLKNLKIEVEVKNLIEFKQALLAKPDMIMLDNMSIPQIKNAVKIRNKNPAYKNIQLEASGGVNLHNVRQIAKTGVEMISAGALTHSTKDLDVSFEII